MTNKTGVGSELCEDWPWFLMLAVLVVPGAVGLVCSAEPSSAIWDWLSARATGLCFLVTGIALAQIAATVLRDIAAGAAKLDKITDQASRWPQRLLGLTETIGYSIAFYCAIRMPGFKVTDVFTAAGAWIVFKKFGNWPRWNPNEKDTSEIADEKRRRFYVFLFANALQVGFGALIGRGLVWALKN